MRKKWKARKKNKKRKKTMDREDRKRTVDIKRCPTCDRIIGKSPIRLKHLALFALLVLASQFAVEYLEAGTFDWDELRRIGGKSSIIMTAATVAYMKMVKFFKGNGDG